MSFLHERLATTPQINHHQPVPHPLLQYPPPHMSISFIIRMIILPLMTMATCIPTLTTTICNKKDHYDDHCPEHGITTIPLLHPVLNITISRVPTDCLPLTMLLMTVLMTHLRLDSSTTSITSAITVIWKSYWTLVQPSLFSKTKIS